MTAFQPDQLNALVLLFMDTNAFVIIIWGLLFGFHLLLLGYLVYRSRFLPRILGILLFIGGIGYLAQSYRIHEAELYRLTKTTQSEQKSCARLSIALASRSYAILLQAATQFLPFNTTLRQRPATLINPR